MKKEFITVDGNTAVANVAYRLSEVAIIFPITPASPMGELADSYSAHNKKNIFGQKVDVVEMQSEAGASGAIHGALTAGALTTTFTASQGLLLMIPNMHKIAGELLPAVFHVAARSIAAQSLSIFGDHSDVMSVRNTGFAMISSSSVQEAQDMAVIAHISSIKSKIPFLHFFDGFRTSHEIKKIESIDDETLKQLIDNTAIKEFKDSALNPEHPYAKVGAENPDVYFQGRETVNRFYDAVPSIVKNYFHEFYKLTGRKYDLFEYYGHEKPEKLIVSMGSSTETIEETVNCLVENGEKVGFIKVRLFRPFSVEDFVKLIPDSVKSIAVLDRTKEPGSIGEPLYLDVVAALNRAKKDIKVVGGRYGLSSKEFNPDMVFAIYDMLDNPKHNFTVGINDDVTHLSLPINKTIDTEKDVIRCKFWGYGSDGTVGASKNTIKIIGESTNNYIQGYFAYDSHKSGGVTISHLRFSKHKIKSTYLIKTVDFIMLNKHSYIGRYDILEGIKENGIFLLNCPWSKQDAFNHLTKDMQETIIKKNIKFFIINADKIAEETGLKTKIGTIMQTAFFKLINIIDPNESLKLIKEHIKKQFARKGQKVIDMNYKAVELAFESIQQAETQANTYVPEQELIKNNESSFAKDVILPIMKLKGDTIPVSKMTINGIVPTGTSRLEKRGIANTVPKWDSKKCIQCGICAMVCPHAAIRIKQIKPEDLNNAPESFETITSNSNKNMKFKVQVYPLDCMSCDACGNCIVQCPTKALSPQKLEDSINENEVQNAEFFDQLDDNLEGVKLETVKGSQLKTPLFEFSGACAGCGETPYIKLLTQLFGENMMIANATGCSSIYGGTFPIIPYTKNKQGKGPAWANSLFEDNAEYGLGFRLAVDANRRTLKQAIEKLLKTGTTLELKTALENLLKAWNSKESLKYAEDVKKHLPDALSKVYGESTEPLNKINELKDYLSDKSVWIIGGDGWAYDIGFGGLDHVLASGKNVKVLVLDTEVYSNTGGQCSKATPRAATAKFAVSGKRTPKKDLGKMMMSYGYVYVASISLGANMNQAIKAFVEAQNYDGPAIIIAYSPCIAHGIDMGKSSKEQKLAVDSGYWPLYRFNPLLAKQGKNPFILDSSASPKKEFSEYINNELRYRSLKIQFPEIADKLFDLAKADALKKLKSYKDMT